MHPRNTTPTTPCRPPQVPVSTCPDCQQRGPFTLDHERSVYGNYQRITLQEAPGSVPPGRVPRYKEVILLGDLIDVVGQGAEGYLPATHLPFAQSSLPPLQCLVMQARPGEEVEITGVYTHAFDANLNARQGFPVFTTVLEANFVATKTDRKASEVLTADERAEIERLSKDPHIVQVSCCHRHCCCSCRGGGGVGAFRVT